MEWLKIKTSTEMVRVNTEEIVYVKADGNYSDLVLTNGRRRTMTFQLHFFDETFKQLRNNTFVRVGRSLIVNKRYVFIINLTEQTLTFTGQHLRDDIKPLRVSRDALKQLMELLAEEKGGTNE
jgi:DNA-binding LytR/AlgR family response regulator